MCCCIIGWSDFCDFRKAKHFSADQVYFYEFNPKKLTKNHRDLKNEFVFENLLKTSFYIKEKSPNRNFEIKQLKYFFLFLQKVASTFFDLNNSKHFFSYSSFLALKKIIEYIPPPQLQASKTLTKLFSLFLG